MKWELNALKMLAKNSTVPGFALQDAISEIDAQAATIAELQRDNAALRAGLEGNERQREIDQNHFALVEKHQADQIRKLTAQVVRMREALEKYADPDHYQNCFGQRWPGNEPAPWVNYEKGETARDALRDDNAAPVSNNDPRDLCRLCKNYGGFYENKGDAYERCKLDENWKREVIIECEDFRKALRDE